MTTQTPLPGQSPPGRLAPAGPPNPLGKGSSASGAGLLSARRKVRLPWAVGGGLTVVATTVAFSTGAGLLSEKTPVLVVTEPLSAGQVITAEALRAIPVAADPGVATIDASQESKVLGRTTAVPLSPGALLGPSDLGKASFPPAGQAELAVALGPGSYPLDLAAGDRVQVVVADDAASAGPAEATHATAEPQLLAVVTQVGRVSGQSGVIADLLMDQDSFARVASVGSSRVALAVLPPTAGN